MKRKRLFEDSMAVLRKHNANTKSLSGDLKKTADFFNQSVRHSNALTSLRFLLQMGVPNYLSSMAALIVDDPDTVVAAKKAQKSLETAIRSVKEAARAIDSAVGDLRDVDEEKYKAEVERRERKRSGRA